MSAHVFRRLAAALAALALGGCIASEAHLRRRAAFDMQCSENELQIVDLGGWNRGVKGCGKQATYVFVQNTGWVLNTDAAPTGGSEGY